MTGEENGNLIFAGIKQTQTFGDFALAKINPSGDILWTGVYNGQGNTHTNHDEPAAICTDLSGNVYMTGRSSFISSYYFSTIKYSPEGAFQWERLYSNPMNGGGGNDIVSDNAGNIYITGGSNDFTTIKYSSNGDSIWTKIYNGTANLNDFSEAIGIDISGNVYIAGRSRKSGSPVSYELVTIKYSQILTGVSSDINTVSSYELLQNYPNPFNPLTNLEFKTAESGFVSLKVYDPASKEIATLVNSFLNSGKHKYIFDGVKLSSGKYFYELKITQGEETFSSVKQMILLK